MRKAISVAGLFYGDEGKGTMVDYLTHQNKATLVVRYNGGCQAAHNVVTNDGRHHTFQQIGAGAFHGAETYLSEYCLVNPIALANEMEVFRVANNGKPAKVTVSPGAVVVTPIHRFMNQYREIVRGKARHGSVGVGIGEARAEQLSGRPLLWRDLGFIERVEEHLAERKQNALLEIGKAACDGYSEEAIINLNKFKVVNSIGQIDCHATAVMYRDVFLHVTELSDTFDVVSRKHDVVIFEGAQGVMLDETHGFAPYNTWTDCTWGNVYRLLDQVPYEDHHIELERIVVMRSYLTRHGFGPFITENPDLVSWEHHNKEEAFMGSFRFGHFDVMLGRKAVDILGGKSAVDALAITHMDNIISPKVCIGYQFSPHDFMDKLTATQAYMRNMPIYTIWGTGRDEWIRNIQSSFGVPVKYVSSGPRTLDKEIQNVKLYSAV